MTCANSIVSDSLTMVCIPANTTGFLMGSTVVGGSAAVEHTVASITAFAMAKYEVKYADWLTVKNWAEAQIPAYSFANVGQMGSASQTNQHPVTTVNWRDAIIWCNAASQRAGLTPVYYTDSGFSTPLKIVDNAAVSGATTLAGAEDNPYVKWSADGYRLPTEAEWEYAARYIDGTAFMRGDAPSGWVDSSNIGFVDAAENDPVAWYATNSSLATHVVGTALGNALGLFDMSGNVYEWVWDWHAGNYAVASPYTDADSKGPTSGTFRVGRGGGWAGSTTDLQSSGRGSSVNSPASASSSFGFRPVRRP